MGNFFKDSFAELEHVVWPTHQETKNFLRVVLSVIVVMTVFTYLLTLVFGNSLFAVRAWIHAPKTADLSASPVVSGEPLKIDGGTIEVTPEIKP